MPGVGDWVLYPHFEIERIFGEQGGNNDWKRHVLRYFNDLFDDPQSLANVPWLNETKLHMLSSNQLVRFRGMIQDMKDAEFYLDLYEVKNKKTGDTKVKPGCFKDIAKCGPDEELIFDSKACKTKDRLSYLCISIPGENSWVKEAYGSSSSPLLLSNFGASSSKRKMDANNDATYSDMQCGHETLDGFDSKKPKSEATQSSSAPSSDSAFLRQCHPIQSEDNMACLIKLYNEEELSLNDIVEVVGILSVDPLLSASSESEFEMDIDEPSPPASLVPRLHALRVKRMPHINPLHAEAKPEPCPREIREELRKVFQEALLGDPLAADYLICHLVSSVHMRQDMLALGKFSLNLYGLNNEVLDQDYVLLLYGLVQRLTTHSHFLPMTLANMNSLNFIPYKDYTQNMLVSGLLQMSPNTHLVLNETAMSTGQLDAKGVRNITALGNVINCQKLDYDFKFHHIEQHTNIPVLILSEGKSMIQSDCIVKLECKHSNVKEAFELVDRMLTSDLLTGLRNYLTSVRLLKYNVTEEMQQFIQDDFVKSRQQENGMSADDLHNCLGLSRLLSISVGLENLTKDVWKSTKILENERKLRLS